MQYVIVLGCAVFFHRFTTREGMSPWGWVIASVVVNLLVMRFAAGLFPMLAGQGLLLFAIVGYDTVKRMSG